MNRRRSPRYAASIHRRRSHTGPSLTSFLFLFALVLTVTSASLATASRSSIKVNKPLVIHTTGSSTQDFPADYAELSFDIVRRDHLRGDVYRVSQDLQTIADTFRSNLYGLTHSPNNSSSTADTAGVEVTLDKPMTWICAEWDCDEFTIDNPEVELWTRDYAMPIYGNNGEIPMLPSDTNVERLAEKTRIHVHVRLRNTSILSAYPQNHTENFRIDNIQLHSYIDDARRPSIELEVQQAALVDAIRRAEGLALAAQGPGIDDLELVVAEVSNDEVYTDDAVQYHHYHWSSFGSRQGFGWLTELLGRGQNVTVSARVDAKVLANPEPRAGRQIK